MAQDSKIEWTHHTANLWHGCVGVSLGCDNCYAETLSKRWGNDIWGNDKPRKQIKSVWNDLIKYQKLAKEAKEMHRVFVGSMMDIFEKPMPLIDSKGNKIEENTGDLRYHFFKNIDTAPNLIFLLLTKRPSNINKYIPDDWKKNPPENIMFGTSPVNQETADKLIPQLLKAKGKRFLSVEPQLGFIDFNKLYEGMTIPLEGISQVIVGGESGHRKRPFNPEWARHIRDVCKKHNVPFFMKQWDKIKPIPDDLLIRQFPKHK